jgi:hypothetical protein
MMVSHKLGDEKRGKKEPKIDPTHLIVILSTGQLITKLCALASRLKH